MAMTTAFPNPRAIKTSGYGPRWGTMHYGIDLAGGEKRIVAFAEGKVTGINTGCMVGNDACGSGGGNWVKIEHSNGYKTKYYHLTQVQVKAGQWVKAGEQIGTEGNTGYSRGAHLHFGLENPQGQMIDPEPYIFGRKEFPGQDSIETYIKVGLLGLVVILAIALALWYFRKEILLAYKKGFQKAKEKIS